MTAIMEENLLENDRKRYADHITLQELVRLRVENERVRKALHDCIYVLAMEGAIEGSLRVIEIVSAALQQKDSEQ